MMTHCRMRLSIQYFLYSLMTRLAISHLGGFFFRKTKSKVKDPQHLDRFSRMWWHYYLLRFAYYYKEGDKDLLGEEKNIRVTKTGNYTFAYYDVTYHTNCLSHILFELERGNRAVIDDKEKIWGEFFKQPFAEIDPSIPESEVAASLYMSKYIPYNKRIMKIWRKIYKEFTVLNERTEAYIQEECKEIFKENRRVLGVFCRGTDYIILKPKHHPKQPKVEEVIKVAKKWVKKYHYDYIYLATEDSTILEKFEKEFPGMILQNKRQYFDKKMKENNINHVTQVKFDRENDKYWRGIEYMSSMYILSKCDALLGGNASGIFIPLCANEGYEHEHVFDRGLY